ncbi:hypothetical protein WJX74_000124 [Apatococcus lobatus]|uniref:Cytochrome b5 domain-containing protein 1 n=1 Tax=Apatococcus lobatus TaxID=904363 RepID=A0AAW1RW42_9CHLO
MGQVRYFTPAEVAQHNTLWDCWVTFLGRVYNVTSLVKAQPGPAAQPIIQAAGTDISSWFDADTGDVKVHRSSETGMLEPDCPQGRFIHVPPSNPSSYWDGSFLTPWWSDDQYCVGRLTARVLQVLVRNVLAEDTHVLEVPEEETMQEIQQRYHSINRHAGSYIWTALPQQAATTASLQFTMLDMTKTLHENRVFGAAPTPAGVDEHIPTLNLYWTDDLTTDDGVQAHARKEKIRVPNALPTSIASVF